ncbi:AhpC/TSA family protein [Ketogulonicigenium vulgare Y25]|uniref:thioredoxin-dependent peroxiredoxin n=2 Tax=Ketogulonicigenium vulgare TaxID=92945 RepID=F9Y979_KETVW|nr:AhpC/TSA family protein [Ketogulonicigenium vulgare Y25]AEM41296.1 Glutamate-ammonia-ligase adenylyltransferase [Ketogulonicigenium vulgare WSH-001]AOZ55029.1 AhpC/TSA family protein [Ketogulonicigenium vulgare]
MPKDQPMTRLQAGDTAPNFTLPGHDGKTYHLSDFRGQRVVLFFYPADNTPTCTTENAEFATHAEAFAAAGVQLIGINRDSLAKHTKFAAKLALPFPLLTDEDGAVSGAYDVWQEKSTFGKTYMGILRTTFLIGTDGRLEMVWPVTRLAGHVDSVLTSCLSKN